MIHSKNGGRRQELRKRFDLIPHEGLAAEAEIFHEGAEKYDEDNWKGLDFRGSETAPINHAFDHLSKAAGLPFGSAERRRQLAKVAANAHMQIWGEANELQTVWEKIKDWWSPQDSVGDQADGFAEPAEPLDPLSCLGPGKYATYTTEECGSVKVTNVDGTELRFSPNELADSLFKEKMSNRSLDDPGPQDVDDPGEPEPSVLDYEEPQPPTTVAQGLRSLFASNPRFEVSLAANHSTDSAEPSSEAATGTDQLDR